MGAAGRRNALSLFFYIGTGRDQYDLICGVTKTKSDFSFARSILLLGVRRCVCKRPACDLYLNEEIKSESSCTNLSSLAMAGAL
jgi:hypothetical protein